MCEGYILTCRICVFLIYVEETVQAQILHVRLTETKAHGRCGKLGK